MYILNWAQHEEVVAWILLFNKWSENTHLKGKWILSYSCEDVVVGVFYKVRFRKKVT